MSTDGSDAQSAVAYENKIWDGDLPAPTGNLTKKIEKILKDGKKITIFFPYFSWCQVYILGKF